jgi:glycosyltransferase involved in cell wall biosynthesis
MRLTIDAVPLLVRSAGVKNYLFHWIAHLRRLLGDREVALFPALGRLPDLDHEGSAANPAGTLARQALLYALNLRPNHVWDWIGPPADIFHATKLRNPPRRPRLTATLHDVTCWLMPEMHQAANVAAEQLFADCIWKRAAGLIAVSENTRRDAARVLGLDAAKIRVIYPGVAETFFDAAPAPCARPYVLYVGTLEPRKNVDRLLDAWSSLPAGLRAEFDLAAAGPQGWHADRTMARLRSPEMAACGVRYLGYVPEPQMPGLTAGATIFVYPSLYEGFGFPVAQAMAAGVPVITSGVSSLPEIAGGAAALVDPRSVDEIRAALERLLTSPSARAQMAQAGRVQAQRFRWESCARQSVEFFEQLLGSA